MFGRSRPKPRNRRPCGSVDNSIRAILAMIRRLVRAYPHHWPGAMVTRGGSRSPQAHLDRKVVPHANRGKKSLTSRSEMSASASVQKIDE